MQGGCHCGAIRYEVSAMPFAADYCHCSDCRRTTGAPVGVWMDFKADEVSWLKGSVCEYASSEHIRRGFCPQCGSSLTYRSTRHPDYFTLSVASLDDPNLVRPTYHIFTCSQVDWMAISDDCKRYARGQA